VDMLWCQGAQNIGLSNRKLKSTLTCTVWSHSQCTTVVSDRQTDRQTDDHCNSATIVLTNALRGNNDACLYTYIQSISILSEETVAYK